MSTPKNQYQYSTKRPGLRSSGLAVTVSEPEADNSDSSLDLSDISETNSDFGDITAVINIAEEGEPEENMAGKLKMPEFFGNAGHRAEDWLRDYEDFCAFLNYNDDRKKIHIKFLLQGHAKEFFNSLAPEIQSNYAALKQKLIDRFSGDDGSTQLWDITQQNGETTADYFTRVLRAANYRSYPPEMVSNIAVRGLRPELKQIVMPQGLQTLDQVRKAAQLAEQSLAGASASGNPAVDVLQHELLNLKELVMGIQEVSVMRQQPQPNERPTWGRQQDDNRGCYRCGEGFTISRVLALLMLVWCSFGSCNASTEIIQRLNYGIIFKQSDKVVMGSDTWYHTFVIDLPDTVASPYVVPCTDNNVTCTLLSSLITQLNGVRSETSTRLRETIKTIEDLVPETKIHKSRSKRALLSFIGRLSKGLFGTATVDDFNVLAKQMNKISKMTVGLSNAMVQHDDHLSSYITSANERMDNLMLGIKDNMHAITSIQHELFTNMENIETSFNTALGMMTQQIRKMAKINHELEEFKLGILDLVNGKLSPLLVPHHVMENTINDIQNILQTKFSGFHISVANTNEIYKLNNFLFARNASKLYVTIKLPVSNFEKPLTLYEIVSLPVPVNATSEHGTQILSITKYFMVTSNHQYYAEQDIFDFSVCQGDEVKYCSKNVILNPVTTQSCVLALYTNDKDLVKSMCEFRFMQSVIKPKLIEIIPNSLVVYRLPLMSMQCSQAHQMIKGCDFCIIEMPCKCSISTKDFYLAPRLTNCHVKQDNITVVHPVNLVLLQHFFENDFVNQINADTTFKAAINVTVPHFNMYNHEMSNVIAADSKAHLNLSKMAEATKNDKKIFQSIAEPLIDNQIQLQSVWPDLDGILLICCLGVVALLCIATTWSVWKVKVMSAILINIQKAKRANAMATDLPSFIYTAKPTTTESYNFDINLSWGEANFIMLSIVLFIALIFIYKKCKQSRTSKLCLEIVAGHCCVLVDVHRLPMCLSNYNVCPPESISDLEVSDDWFFPTLSICWPGFQIINTQKEETIEVSSKIKIGPWTAYKLRKNIRKSFFTYLHTYHSGILSPLQNQIKALQLS